MILAWRREPLPGHLRSLRASDPCAPKIPGRLRGVIRRAAELRRMDIARTDTAGRPEVRLSFSGDGGTLFGIHIINLLLGIVTLGIYYFWGKVRVQRFLHSQMEFDGDRFAYHGTGVELLVGFLKTLGLVVLGMIGLALLQLFGARPETVAVATLLIYPVLLVVIPVAIAGSRRYRLSRASWRGIRFSFRGQTGAFVKMFVSGALLTVITFGLYYPFFYNNMWRFLISNTYYGTVRFEFDGSGADLFGSFLLAVVLTPLTLGLYWFWFTAHRQRYMWTRTSFAAARFRCTVTGGRLFRLTLGNGLLLFITLGLAFPWVQARNIRFLCGTLAVEGLPEMDAIRQEAQAASPTGEAIADFLGLDFPGLAPGW